ncbi:MAG: DNA replication/repair protein RecF [Actinomycetota bacterium]|nr:DNA replication/repair protein RecF [Actinomycetota bacterium]
MHVTHLGLVDFRSYATVELDLPIGVTTFVGANGEGKTNLVEAIGYASALRSHRVATDAPLVRRGADRAVVRVHADRGGREVIVELEITPGKANRARLNRSPVPRQRDVLGQVSRVLFAPEDLWLVKGDPGERRTYLDELLVALAPRFDAVLSDLERVLRQRNSLLKSASALRGGGGRTRAAAEATLSVWDDQLATLASDVIAGRDRLVDRLTQPLADSYRAVAPGDRDPEARIEYVPGVPESQGRGREEIAEQVRIALAARRDEEFARGITLVGPHRDELAVTLHGMPVRGYASHGESWSMALALRLASYDIVRADSGPGGEPVLILDDVFAELDADRRERLALAVADVEQVLITAAVPEDVPKVLTGATVPVLDLVGDAP